jgi:hypothetical protein
MVCPVARYTLACLFSLALTSACSDGALQGDTSPIAAEQRSFSDQEKLAAQKLSMGSSALSAASGPYAQAIVCMSSIEALAERLQQSPTQNDVQVRAIVQAKALLDRELQAAAAQEGKSSSAVRQDLEQAVEDAPDIGTQAQVAITCLQRLQ